MPIGENHFENQISTSFVFDSLGGSPVTNPVTTRMVGKQKVKHGRGLSDSRPRIEGGRQGNFFRDPSSESGKQTQCSFVSRATDRRSAEARGLHRLDVVRKIV